MPWTACSDSSSAGAGPGAGQTALPDFFAAFNVNSGGVFRVELVGLDGLNRRTLIDSQQWAGFEGHSGHLSSTGRQMIALTGGASSALLIDNEQLSGQTIFPSTPAQSSNPFGVAWAPRGNAFLLQFATSPTSFDTYVSPQGTLNASRINPDGQLYTFAGWSKDGSMFAVHDHHATNNAQQLRVLSAAGTPLTDLADGEAYTGEGVFWAQNYLGYPVDRELAGVQYKGLNQFKEANGSSSALTPLAAAIRDVDYSPDGSWLTVVHRSVPPAHGAGTLLFDQDFASNPLNIVQSDVDVLETRNLGWSPAGDRFALAYSGVISNTTDLSGDRLAMISVAGVQQSVLENPAAGSRIAELAWSPNGRYLAFTSDHVSIGVQRLFLVDTHLSPNPVLMTPMADPGVAGSLVWNSDSSWLYSTHRAGFDRLLVGAPMANFGSLEVLAHDLVDPGSAFEPLQGTQGRPGIVFVRRSAATNSDEVVYLDGHSPASEVVLTQAPAPGETLRVTQLWVRGLSSGL